MKRLLMVAGACLFACAAYAAEAQDTKWVQGTVSAVGPASVTVTVKGQEMTFNVDDKTELTAPGGSTATRAARAEGKSGARLAEVVKAGQGVEVRYHAEGMHAASIRVLPAARPGATSDERARTATGEVTAVSASSLTVKGKEGEWTFTVNDKTDVIATGAGTKSREKKSAGAKIVLSDFVTTGDTVSVRYTESGGDRVASEVRVTRKRSNP